MSKGSASSLVMGIADCVPCKIYDIETKTVIKICRSRHEAAIFLGLKNTNTVNMSIKGKHKTFSPVLKKKVAIRNHHEPKTPSNNVG